MTDIKQGRFLYGGVRTRVDPSRIRPVCLGRVSQDPLIFCQGIPRPGMSTCDECLDRNRRPVVLERLLRDEARRLLEMSWKRPSLVDHAELTVRLGEVRKFLRLAGLSCVDVDAEWNERFRLYKTGGGRSSFRELRGYNW